MVSYLSVELQPDGGERGEIDLNYGLYDVVYLSSAQSGHLCTYIPSYLPGTFTCQCNIITPIFPDLHNKLISMTFSRRWDETSSLPTQPRSCSQ